MGTSPPRACSGTTIGCAERSPAGQPGSAGRRLKCRQNRSCAGKSQQLDEPTDGMLLKGGDYPHDDVAVQAALDGDGAERLKR
jgi:hypothetical protein